MAFRETVLGVGITRKGVPGSGWDMRESGSARTVASHWAMGQS